MKSLEHVIERGIFASRWLMAPMYVGLVGALMLLLAFFIRELAEFAYHVLTLSKPVTQTEMVMGILSLIDLSLSGNLLLIVIFSGYENFVSKIDIGEHEDQPEWKGNVDFSALKLKLIASIVAISGIHLLKVFMEMEQTETPEYEIKWMVIIHLVFVISGVLLALMDRIAIATKSTKEKMKME